MLESRRARSTGEVAGDLCGHASEITPNLHYGLVCISSLIIVWARRAPPTATPRKGKPLLLCVPGMQSDAPGCLHLQSTFDGPSTAPASCTAQAWRGLERAPSHRNHSDPEHTSNQRWIPVKPMSTRVVLEMQSKKCSESARKIRA